MNLDTYISVTISYRSALHEVMLKGLNTNILMKYTNQLSTFTEQDITTKIYRLEQSHFCWPEYKHIRMCRIYMYDTCI